MRRNFRTFAAFTALLTAVTGNSLAATQETLSIVERGASHRVWERETVEILPDGREIRDIGTYTELQDGLHYLEEGQWKEAQELIEAFEEGFAARKGQQKVIFANNLKSAGAVDMEANGTRLRATVLALFYYDPVSGQQVMLGQVQDSQAQLVEPNGVIYVDAFDGISADVLYVYKKTGVAQYVLLRESPPTPEQLGMSDETRIEVLTEWYDPPVPQKRHHLIHSVEDALLRAQMVEPDFVDERLDFGGVKIIEGQAFWLEEGLPSPDIEGTRVGKHWETGPNGRTILFEGVRHQDLSSHFDQLPQASIHLETLQERAVAKVGKDRFFPEPITPSPGRQDDASHLIADTSILSAPALVLDFVTLGSSSQTDYTFEGGSTYYVTGSVYLYGTTTIEGGAVIKYGISTSTDRKQMFVKGALDCRTSLYRPAVFTAKDDNGVGQTISGSSGAPSGHYAYVALYLHDTQNNMDIRHIRISDAKYGLAFYKNTSNTLRHGQFRTCGFSVAAHTCTLTAGNVLVDAAIAQAFRADAASVTVEHATVIDGSSLFWESTASSFTFYNSLFANVNTINSYAGSDNYAVSNYSDAFTDVGAGRGYHKGITYKDIGGAIDSSLHSDLKNMTTEPPALLTSDVTAGGELYPQVARDRDQLDIGYHYPPIDFVASERSLTSELVLRGGVTLATYGAYGFDIGSGGRFMSKGRAENMNRVFNYHAVQEQLKWPNEGTGSYRGLFRVSGSHLTIPVIDLDFTEVAAFGRHEHLVTDTSAYYLKIIDIRNSRINGCRFGLYPSNGSNGQMYVALENSILDTCAFTLYKNYYYGSVLFDFDVRSCTFQDGSLDIVYDSTSYPWSFTNNLFDAMAISVSSNYGYTVENSHNAYYTSDPLDGTYDATDRQLTSPPEYTSGAFGDKYFLPSGNLWANLIDQGSGTAEAAGLYHFTVKNSNEKEGGSPVDIGAHYVAAEAALPGSASLDFDGDTVPDYVEDADGNGTADAGESDWETYDSPNGLTGGLFLQVLTPLNH